MGSTSFPVRRVSSVTDLLRWKEGRKSRLRLSKSEGTISSSEALVKDCPAQRLLHICEYEEDLQSDETVSITNSNGRSIDPSIHLCLQFDCFNIAIFFLSCASANKSLCGHFTAG